MKTILLMRHAAAAWKAAGQFDRDRPLSAQGREACTQIGGWMVAKHALPQHAIVSGARRTVETWQAVAPLLGPPEHGLRVEDGLYMAGPDAMLAFLRSTPESASTVLMLAHQPGTGALAHLLSGKDICAGSDRAFSHFPTAAVAVLEADIANWSDLDFGSAACRYFTCPQDLSRP